MLELKSFAENLNQQLAIKLININKNEDLLKRFRLTSEAYYDSLLHLKSHVQHHNFKDLDEEIHFFREIKPMFLCEFLFHQQVLTILSKIPIGNDEELLNYYNNKLLEITSFFKTNLEFYQYYRLQLTHNDTLFFVRQKKELICLLDTGCINFDPNFSSSHDHILAQLMANEKLELFIKNQILGIANSKHLSQNELAGSNPKSPLHWTDSKAAIVELIYSLYAAGSINNGQVEIRELSSFFEDMFNIKLPDIYRTYLDLKIRTSQTKFIDNLKSALLRKMEEDL